MGIIKIAKDSPNKKEGTEKNEEGIKKDEEGKDEEEEQAEEKWEEPYEWKKLCDYFCDNSPEFVTLQDKKKEGRNNEHVVLFFAAKETNQDNSRSRVENVKALFSRFYRYAIEIDIGTGYVKDILDRKGTKFLEFGYAPGGMSRLLLDATPEMTGLGITLDPEEGGNVYPDDFNIQ
eukprot:UN22445